MELQWIRENMETREHREEMAYMLASSVEEEVEHLTIEEDGEDDI